MINTVIQQDCTTALKGLADSSVDLICVDPPYFKFKEIADNPAHWWDHQWKTAKAYLAWLDEIAEQWQRILKPNGSLYCFASPRLAASVEVLLANRFSILNRITWDKAANGAGGWHYACNKERLRRFFSASEAILFCEQKQSDLAYAHRHDSLRANVFEPLRAYLDGERIKAGITKKQIQDWFAAHGYPKYSVARHAFSRSQWELITAENYARLKQCFAELAGDSNSVLEREYDELKGKYDGLKGEYDELKGKYDGLKGEYEALRRPFAVTKSVPYTDVWGFPVVQYYPGKHPCEKPAPLLEHIITASSRPGDVVLDCFAGSGSTLIAAQKLGRNYIGIEVDPHWVSYANECLGNAAAPVTSQERQDWLQRQLAGRRL